ncbi:uncharacterized protein LOC134216027 [Armigeres subalbatus]|uniref:uncharacterized protein LOC134216027 n=1 Tax=Armigeres subalbatus TaxID=124917 RepID=UPI002ED57980
MDFANLQMLLDAAELLSDQPDQTLSTVTADHPSLQYFNFSSDSSVMEAGELSSAEYTGTTMTAIHDRFAECTGVTLQEQREVSRNSVDTVAKQRIAENSHIQFAKRQTTAISPSDFAGQLGTSDVTSISVIGCRAVSVLASTSHAWNERRQKTPGHEMLSKRINMSLPAGVLRDYSGGNILVTCQPDEESFMPRKTRKLSKSLPVNINTSNISSGNVLFRKHHRIMMKHETAIVDREASSKHRFMCITDGRGFDELSFNTSNLSEGNVLFRKHRESRMMMKQETAIESISKHQSISTTDGKDFGEISFENI